MAWNRAATFLVGAGLALLPSELGAQSLFVSGTMFANVYRTGEHRTESPARATSDRSGTSTGGAVGVGTTIGPHVVVQVELMAPAAIRRTLEPGQLLPPFPQPPLRTVVEVEDRTRHGAILGGYRTAARQRVSAAFLGGVMFMQARTRRTETSVSPPPTQPLPWVSTTRSYHAVPVFGFDLAVSAFAGLSIVPQMRLYKGTGSWGAIGVWPGVSVRWTF